MARTARRPWHLRVYRLLLSAYPRRFPSRALHDLEQIFGDRYRAIRRGQGGAGLLRLWLRTFADVGLNAFLEHFDGLQSAAPKRRNEMLHSIRQDLSFGLRTLFKNKLFALAAISTLALGVGANTAIFSVVDGVLLKPLPYAEPDRLISIKASTTLPNWYGTSEPEFVDLDTQLSSFQNVTAYDSIRATIDDPQTPRRILLQRTTADLLPMLGVSPEQGRFFSAEEDVPGRDLVIVLSHGLWQSQFGGRPDLVGQSITIEGRTLTVVGIMPSGFSFPNPETQAWVPLRLNMEKLWERNNHYLGVLGRLAPGVSLEQARREADALAERSTEAYPEFYGGSGRDAGIRQLHYRLQPALDAVVGQARSPLLLLLGAVGLVLLIACVNVANLLLARGEARKREIAIRSAMGAVRGRVTRQLLTESLLLALAGGVLGVLLAVVGTQALISLAPQGTPRLENVAADGRLLLFSLLLTLATGLAFGVVPAFHGAHTDVGETLKEGSRTQAGNRSRRTLRRVLVASQVALAVVLLLGAGILLRSFYNLYTVDPGIRLQDVLTMQIALPRNRYKEPQKIIDFYRTLDERLSGMQGIESVGSVARLPLASGYNVWSFLIEGRAVANVSEAPAASVQQATPGYFQALGLRLVQGRFFNATDRADSPPVVLINQSMAQTYWPGEDPLGKHMKVFVERYPWMEVVGVVRDVKHEGITSNTVPRFYVPHAQGRTTAYVSPSDMTLVLHAPGNPLGQAPVVQQVIRELDPHVPVWQVRTMEQVFAVSIAAQRFTMLLLSVFAAVALFLGTIGIYGVISFGVSEQRHEIGLRLALGAPRRLVLTRVVREGAVLAGIGTAAGLAGAAALSQAFQEMLFGVSPLDPVTYAGVVLLLLFFALTASLLPALRASRLDPMTALREL